MEVDVLNFGDGGRGGGEVSGAGEEGDGGGERRVGGVEGYVGYGSGVEDSVDCGEVVVSWKGISMR